jgi:hypothetical protein
METQREEAAAVRAVASIAAMLGWQHVPPLRLLEADIRALKARASSGRGGFDFLAHLQRQREFSERTFGPGARTLGVVAHIRKELLEIEAKPDDLEEWIDVVILALDGAWRAGASPREIVEALEAKQTKNESRTWPDWRTVGADRPIEHDRRAEV